MKDQRRSQQNEPSNVSDLVDDLRKSQGNSINKMSTSSNILGDKKVPSDLLNNKTSADILYNQRYPQSNLKNSSSMTPSMFSSRRVTANDLDVKHNQKHSHI